MMTSHPRRSIEETLGLLISLTSPVMREKPEFQAWLSQKYKEIKNVGANAK